MSANDPWLPPTTGGPAPGGVPPWSGPPPGPYSTGPAPYPGGSPYAPPPSPYAPPPSPYGPAAQGPAPYGPPPYGPGQAPYGSPSPYTPPPRRLTGGRLALVAVAFLAVLAVVVGLIAAGASVLAPDDGYGDDPRLDQLWDACADGDGAACEDLYRDSPLGSEYEEFGDTCGGRVPPGRTYCEGVIDPPGSSV